VQLASIEMRAHRQQMAVSVDEPRENQAVSAVEAHRLRPSEIFYLLAVTDRDDRPFTDEHRLREWLVGVGSEDLPGHECLSHPNDPCTSVDGLSPIVNNHPMDSRTPWFAKPWKKSARPRGSAVAAVGYLVAGFGSVGLAATTDRGVGARVAWAVTGAVFLALGLTLLATLRWRRKNPDG